MAAASDPIQRPIKALASHVRLTLEHGSSVRIPKDLLSDLRAAPRPMNLDGLDELIDVFAGTKHTNILRLDSCAFYTIVQLLFFVYFEQSIKQEKTIFQFMHALDVLKDYSDQNTLPQYHANMDRFTAVSSSEYLLDVIDKMAKFLLQLVIDSRMRLRARIIASQMLVCLLQAHPDSCRWVSGLRGPLWHSLVSLIEEPKPAVLRLVAADVVRQMAHGGVPCNLFWPTELGSNPYVPFPSAPKANSEWTGKVIDLWQSQDDGKLPNPLQRPVFFCLSTIEIDDRTISDPDGNIVAAFAESQIIFLLPAESFTRIQAIFVPLFLVCATKPKLDNNGNPAVSDSVLTLTIAREGYVESDGSQIPCSRIALVFSEQDTLSYFADLLKTNFKAEATLSQESNYAKTGKELSHLRQSAAPPINMTVSSEVTTSSFSLDEFGFGADRVFRSPYMQDSVRSVISDNGKLPSEPTSKLSNNIGEEILSNAGLDPPARQFSDHNAVATEPGLQAHRSHGDEAPKGRQRASSEMDLGSPRQNFQLQSSTDPHLSSPTIATYTNRNQGLQCLTHESLSSLLQNSEAPPIMEDLEARTERIDGITQADRLLDPKLNSLKFKMSHAKTITNPSFFTKPSIPKPSARERNKPAQKTVGKEKSRSSQECRRNTLEQQNASTETDWDEAFRDNHKTNISSARIRKRTSVASVSIAPSVSSPKIQKRPRKQPRRQGKPPISERSQSCSDAKAPTAVQSAQTSKEQSRSSKPAKQKKLGQIHRDASSNACKIPKNERSNTTHRGDIGILKPLAQSNAPQQNLQKPSQITLALCRPNTESQNHLYQTCDEAPASPINPLPRTRKPDDTIEEPRRRHLQLQQAAAQRHRRDEDDLEISIDKVLNGLSQSTNQSANYNSNNIGGLLTQQESQRVGEGPNQRSQNGQAESTSQSFGSKLAQNLLAQSSLIKGDPILYTGNSSACQSGQQSLSPSSQYKISQRRCSERPNLASPLTYTSEEALAVNFDTSSVDHPPDQVGLTGNILQAGTDASDSSHTSFNCSAGLEEEPIMNNAMAVNKDETQNCSNARSRKVDLQRKDMIDQSAVVEDQIQKKHSGPETSENSTARPGMNASRTQDVDVNEKQTNVQNTILTGEIGKVLEDLDEKAMDSYEIVNVPNAEVAETNTPPKKLSSREQDENAALDRLGLAPSITRIESNAPKNLEDMDPEFRLEGQIVPEKAKRRFRSLTPQSPRSTFKHPPMSMPLVAMTTTPSDTGVHNTSRTTPPAVPRRPYSSKLALAIKERILSPATLRNPTTKNPSSSSKMAAPRFETPIQNREAQTIEHTDSIHGDNRFLTDETIQRKTRLIKFGPRGPQNQGVHSSPLKVGKVPPPPKGFLSSVEKAEKAPKRKAIEILHTSKEDFEIPSKKPILAMASQTLPEQAESLEPLTSELDDGIFLGASGHATSSVEAVDEHLSPKSGEVAVTPGKNASQGSKVDQNGSPRLLLQKRDHALPVSAELGLTSPLLPRSTSPRSENHNGPVVSSEIFRSATPLQKTISPPQPPSSQKRKALAQRDFVVPEQLFPPEVGLRVPLPNVNPRRSRLSETSSISSDLDQLSTSAKKPHAEPSVRFREVRDIELSHASQDPSLDNTKPTNTTGDQPTSPAFEQTKSPKKIGAPIHPARPILVPPVENPNTSEDPPTIFPVLSKISKPPSKLPPSPSTRIPEVMDTFHPPRTDVNDAAHPVQIVNDITKTKAQCPKGAAVQSGEIEVRRARTSGSGQLKRQLPLPLKHGTSKPTVPSLEELIMHNGKNNHAPEKTILKGSTDGSPQLGITSADNETTLINDTINVDDEVRAKNGTRVFYITRSSSSTSSSDTDQENFQDVHEARVQWRKSLQGAEKSTSEMLLDLSDLLLFKLATAGEGVTIKVRELERGGHWLLDNFANKAAQCTASEKLKLEPLRQERSRAYERATLAIENTKKDLRKLKSIRELEDTLQEQSNAVLGKLGVFSTKRHVTSQVLQE